MDDASLDSSAITERISEMENGHNSAFSMQHNGPRIWHHCLTWEMHEIRDKEALTFALTSPLI